MEKQATAQSQLGASTRTRIVVLKPVKSAEAEPPKKDEKTQATPARKLHSTKKKKKRKARPKQDKEMQILDGKHKGKYLQSTDSPKVRPTARRVREKVFLLLGKRTRKARFLDLCAGSGGVGIEAISRGALLGTFVERSPKMCNFIKQNLANCEIAIGHGEIHEIEAMPFLKKMEKRKRTWDVVFVDPPYDGDYDEILDFFSRGKCLRKEGGMVVIEHPKEMFFPEQLGVLKRRRVILEGETALSFFEYRTKEYVPRPRTEYRPAEKREGGFQRREGGFEKREGGFQKRDGDNRGFPPRRDNNFGSKPSFGERKPNPFGEKREEGGFRPRTSFGEKREGDFRPRPSFGDRPQYRSNTTYAKRDGDPPREPRPPLKPRSE